MCRASSEACLEGQSELESAQPTDDASLPSTSQEPSSSSAGTPFTDLPLLFFQVLEITLSSLECLVSI